MTISETNFKGGKNTHPKLTTPECEEEVTTVDLLLPLEHIRDIHPVPDASLQESMLSHATTLIENDNKLIQAEENCCVKLCLAKQRCIIIYLVFFLMLVFMISRIFVDDMLISNLNSVLRAYHDSQ